MSGAQLLEPNSSPLLTPLAELMDSDDPFIAYNNQDEVSQMALSKVQDFIIPFCCECRSCECSKKFIFS